MKAEHRPGALVKIVGGTMGLAGMLIRFMGGVVAVACLGYFVKGLSGKKGGKSGQESAGHQSRIHSVL